MLTIIKGIKASGYAARRTIGIKYFLSLRPGHFVASYKILSNKHSDRKYNWTYSETNVKLGAEPKEMNHDEYSYKQWNQYPNAWLFIEISIVNDTPSTKCLWLITKSL